MRLENSLRLGSPLLESRRPAGITESPLFKAEVVLLCALGTFAVSALVWTTTHNTKPVAKEPANVARIAPFAIPADVGESEVSRLMKQARQFQVREGVADRVIVRSPQPEPGRRSTDSAPSTTKSAASESTKAVSTLTSTESKAEPAPATKPSVNVEPAATSVAPIKQSDQVFNPPKPDEPERIPSIDEQLERDIPAVKKGAAGKSGTKNDVAAYNRLLEKFFAKPAGAVDGIETAPVLEPPTYEEWISAGKPQF